MLIINEQCCFYKTPLISIYVIYTIWNLPEYLKQTDVLNVSYTFGYFQLFRDSCCCFCVEIVKAYLITLPPLTYLVLDVIFY